MILNFQMKKKRYVYLQYIPVYFAAIQKIKKEIIEYELTNTILCIAK